MKKRECEGARQEADLAKGSILQRSTGTVNASYWYKVVQLVIAYPACLKSYERAQLMPFVEFLTDSFLLLFLGFVIILERYRAKLF